jgi:hypothetical protein
VLVGVLDHDDRGVHHGADGDGDPAERHDVRVELPGSVTLNSVIEAIRSRPRRAAGAGSQRGAC